MNQRQRDEDCSFSNFFSGRWGKKGGSSTSVVDIGRCVMKCSHRYILYFFIILSLFFVKEVLKNQHLPHFVFKFKFIPFFCNDFFVCSFY